MVAEINGEEQEEGSTQDIVESEFDQDPTVQEWRKHEEDNQTKLIRSQLTELTSRPRKTCLHRTFSFVGFVMGMTGLLMLIGQLIGLYFYEMDPIQGVMRCYVVLMCILIILNELQWTTFVRESAILRIWITRGIFYSFVGVLGLEENDTEAATTKHNNNAMIMQGEQVALKFVEVVAYMMVACGALYFVMGLICLQILRNRVVKAYEQRCNEAKANINKIKHTEQNGSIV